MEESSLPVCMKFGAACRPETEEPSMKDPALASSSRLGGAVISDRVVASLLEELSNGRYAQADRLPAEVDLATELGVSRTVIRDALSEMERAGYVERVRGIGTVVNRAVLGLRSRLDQKLEYYPLIRSFGSYPHADGIQVMLLRAGEEMAHALHIACALHLAQSIADDGAAHAQLSGKIYLGGQTVGPGIAPGAQLFQQTGNDAVADHSTAQSVGRGKCRFLHGSVPPFTGRGCAPPGLEACAARHLCDHAIRRRPLYTLL